MDIFLHGNLIINLGMNPSRSRVNSGTRFFYFYKNTVFCPSLNILNLFGELSLVYS